jgi:hypothetical protein
MNNKAMKSFTAVAVTHNGTKYIKPVLINSWSVVAESGVPYRAPEAREMRLTGNVYGHPRHRDGAFLITTNIQGTDGRFVFTRNTVYLLGNPSDTYLAWLDKLGIKIDPKAPIKLK